MAFYLPLFCCVALVMLLEGVVCPRAFNAAPTNSGPIFDNYSDWIKDQKMPGATLTLKQPSKNDHKLPNGFIIPKFRGNNGWFWDFYGTTAWNQASRRIKQHAAPCNSFEINEIGKTANRDGKTVTFMSKIPGSDKMGSYRIDFENENHARIFTGEAWPYTPSF